MRRPPKLSTLSCFSLAIVLTAADLPRPVAAAEPPAPTSSQQAEQTFAAGLASYEAGDFTGAITAWTSARAHMAADPQALDAWHVLGLDLAQAHVRAYRVDRDVGHFEPAQQLLDEYVDWVDRPGHTMDDAEREDRPRALEMLAFIERERAARTMAAAPAPAPVVAPVSVAEAPPVRIDSAPRQRQLKAGRAMIGTGAVALGIGVGSAVAAGVLATRAPRIEREYEALQSEIGNDEPSPAESARLDELTLKGKRANVGVIASAACSAVFLAAGIGLLSGGLVVRKRALRATPAVGPGYAGAAVSLRF